MTEPTSVQHRWPHDVAYFAGALFLTNFVPHFVAGVSGSPFQTPFASPPAVGLSSSPVNVGWALFNLGLAYLLLVRVGSFQLRRWRHVLVFALGVSLAALFLASRLGALHGGLIG